MLNNCLHHGLLIRTQNWCILHKFVISCRKGTICWQKGKSYWVAGDVMFLPEPSFWLLLNYMLGFHVRILCWKWECSHLWFTSVVKWNILNNLFLLYPLNGSPRWPSFSVTSGTFPLNNIATYSSASLRQEKKESWKYPWRHGDLTLVLMAYYSADSHI